MITLFYLIVFIVALIMTANFLIRNKNIDTTLILFSILITINCLGRFLLASAQGLEMALWANKFMYVGGCYAPLLTFIVLARLCDLRIPRILLTLLTAYSTLVMCLVFTIGHSPIYYKEVSLGHGNGYNYLIKTYGPLHSLYPVMMVAYSIAIIVCLVYVISKRKQTSFRTVLTISTAGFGVMIMYILERMLNSSISFLSIGYLFGIALLTKYFQRLNMYDMSSNIILSLEKMNEYGYIVLDHKFRYINSNAFIRKVFPEMNSWHIDKDIPVSDCYFYREIYQPLKEWDVKEKISKTIHVNDQYFQLDVHVLSYGSKKNVGYLLEFIDRTMEQMYYKTIEKYNASLEKEVNEKTEHILHIKDMMVLGMADMVESRDQNTGGHIKRTSAVVRIFSNRLQQYHDVFSIDNDFLQQVAKAAPMHDLGKIAVDDVVLRKPGKYTDEEYNEMKKHTVEGARIVENILHGVEDETFVQIAKNIAHYHHEKWNGRGYPCGLSSAEIPIEARIMALADVFDALVSKRCYKDAFSYEKAYSIIEESLGEHFDPELGKIFLECKPELEALYSSY